MIYHITSRKNWRTALGTGQYRAESLAAEGFIHCSRLSQVLPVAASFYRGQSGLVLLAIEPARLAAPLQWESPSGGSPAPGVPADDFFPHVYGPINLDAVVNVLDLEADSQGNFKILSADLE